MNRFYPFTTAKKLEDFAMMHRKSLVCSAAFASGIFMTAGSVIAAPLTLYDSKNVPIGSMINLDLPTHNFRGTVYAFSADRVGLINDLLKLYPTADCSGQAYDQNTYDALYLPKFTYADEHNDLWGAGDTTLTITVKSYHASWTQTCYQGYWGEQTLLVAPFVEIDSTVAKTWVPPFTVR